jgi:hypothetical protein
MGLRLFANPRTITNPIAIAIPAALSALGLWSFHSGTDFGKPRGLHFSVLSLYIAMII